MRTQKTPSQSKHPKPENQNTTGRPPPKKPKGKPEAGHVVVIFVIVILVVLVVLIVLTAVPLARTGRWRRVGC
jgi:hypothetical protein